jgi:hypothetical protein
MQRLSRSAGVLAMCAGGALAGAGQANAGQVTIIGNGTNASPYTTDNQCTTTDEFPGTCVVDFHKNVDEGMPMMKACPS